MQQYQLLRGTEKIQIINEHPLAISLCRHRIFFLSHPGRLTNMHTTKHVNPLLYKPTHESCLSCICLQLRWEKQTTVSVAEICHHRVKLNTVGERVCVWGWLKNLKCLQEPFITVWWIRQTPLVQAFVLTTLISSLRLTNRWTPKARNQNTQHAGALENISQINMQTNGSAGLRSEERRNVFCVVVRFQPPFWQGGWSNGVGSDS